MFVRWKRTATAKRSLKTNLNKLITLIWGIQIKWWSASLNLGLVNICSSLNKICNNLSQQKYINSPVFNNVSRLNHSSRTNNTLQTKIKPFPHNLLKVQGHPRNENDAFFFLDHPLLSNQISTYIGKKMLIFSRDYLNLPVV